MVSVEEAKMLLGRYLRFNYSLGIDDVEISKSAGWWRIKELCGDDCRHPIHGCLGCGDRMHHTVYYAPAGRDEKGRFLSCYRVWDALKEDSYNEVESI